MSKINVIRAWKDEEYRATLTVQELAALPANPAGSVEFAAVGGADFLLTTSRICAADGSPTPDCLGL
jgi:mersacidin/lichenicidin family type 2 lantibiotic